MSGWKLLTAWTRPEMLTVMSAWTKERALAISPISSKTTWWERSVWKQKIKVHRVGRRMLRETFLPFLSLDFFFSKALASSYLFHIVFPNYFCISHVHWAGGPVSTKLWGKGCPDPCFGGIIFPGESASIWSGLGCSPWSGERARCPKVSQSLSSNGWQWSPLAGHSNRASSCYGLPGNESLGRGAGTSSNLCHLGSTGSSSSGMASRICFQISCVRWGGGGVMTMSSGGSWGVAGCGVGSTAGFKGGSCWVGCCRGKLATGGCCSGTFASCCCRGTFVNGGVMSTAWQFLLGSR